MSDTTTVPPTQAVSADAPSPRIEYVMEGHYLQQDGTRVWKEHSHADTREEAFNPHLGVDTTGRILHQPSEWRITERNLNQLYSVQGLYRARGGRSREWADHTPRVDLDTARLVYQWFHRLCQDPEYDSPTDARVINMGTGETVPMEGFAPPVKQPGDAMRTIAVTPEEWQATRREFNNWDSPIRRGKRRDGTFVWKSGRDYVIGYEDAAGNVRIRPSHYRMPIERAA